jgi:hypothetical protein
MSKWTRCGWCGEKTNMSIYAIRTVSLCFNEGGNRVRRSESVKTVYFCTYQHRLDYFRGPTP